MASGPITSWQIDGETVEIVTDFILVGSKITADVTAAMKLKMLAPWKKSYDQTRKHIKKHRHYFTNKGLSSQGYVFFSSIGMRIGLQRKLSTEELMLLNCRVGEDLRVPWTARRSKQSILKEISPEYSSEGLMLKLKLQYFGHLM